MNLKLSRTRLWEMYQNRIYEINTDHEISGIHLFQNTKLGSDPTNENNWKEDNCINS